MSGGKLRVSYITMQFPAPSETFASNDVRWLRERGVEVSAHGLRGAHPRMSDLLQERGLEGMEVSHNGPAATARGLLTMMMSPRRLARTVAWLREHSGEKRSHLLRSLLLLPRAFDLLRTIRRERPDVVHVYWGHYPAIVGHLVQEYLPETATSISFVAYDLEMEYGASAPVARRADVVRTLASVNVDAIEETFGVPRDEVEIVYDGIDVDRIEAAGRGVTKVPGRIVTVGRLTERKGMYEALEVMARLGDTVPDARLRVLGDGPEADGLRRRAEALGVAGRVEFLGHVSHDRVLREFAEAEVLLLLTKASGERLPNVVKEGMASRCVCVTTPTRGIEELLVHGLHGLVVPAGEVGEAVRAVQWAVGGGPGVEAMVEAAHAHVTTHFDLDTSCARYVELWRRAVRGKRLPSEAESARGSRMFAS